MNIKNYIVMFTVIFASFFPSKELSTARANTLGSLGGLQGGLGGSLDGQLELFPHLAAYIQVSQAQMVCIQLVRLLTFNLTHSTPL